MPKFMDLTGQQFGRLTAIKRAQNTKNGHTRWYCSCKCNSTTIVVVTSSDLKSGHTTSCGCFHKERIRNIKYKGTKNICGHRWNNIKQNAKQRNLDFNITIEWAQKKLEEQNFKCYFTGLEIISPNNYKNNINGNWTASIDRLDPKLNYTEDNCVWVHKDINIIKNICSEIEFLEWCLLIYLFQEKLYIPFKRDITIFKYHNSFRGYGNISGNYWSSLQHSANKRKINFSISIEQIWQKYIEQNGKCAISGLNIDFEPPSLNNKKRYLKTASLDRIDNNNDYNINNIQWVHKKINNMRQDYTMQEFLYYIYLVVIYRKLI